MIHAVGQSIYRTVTSYPITSGVGGVALVVLGVGLCSKRPTSEKRKPIVIDWQDRPNQPLPQWFKAKPIKGDLGRLLSPDEKGWLSDLFNPLRWDELKRAIADQPISDVGERAIAGATGLWADSPRWGSSFAVGCDRSLIDCDENRKQLKAYLELVRDRILPEAERLFQLLPAGKKKEELATLIAEMERVRQEPLIPANLTPLWQIQPARDREWMEEIVLPEEGPWLQNRERQSEALLSERGRYATLLWALQHSSIEAERSAFAAWNRPEETGLTGFWWKDCWGLGKTFFVGVGSLERTLRGFKKGELDPLPFDPAVGAELTIRVWEAILINHGASR